MGNRIPRWVWTPEVQDCPLAHVLRRVAHPLRRFWFSGWPLLRGFSKGRRVWLFLSDEFVGHGTEDKSKRRPFKTERVGYPEKLNQSLSVDALEWYHPTVTRRQKENWRRVGHPSVCGRVGVLIFLPLIEQAQESIQFIDQKTAPLQTAQGCGTHISKSPEGWPLPTQRIFSHFEA
jgi:hypothetical protein